MKKTTRSAALGALALASVLALTACGGSGGGSDNASGGSAGGSDHQFIYLTNDPIGVNKFLESGRDGIEAAATKYNGTSKTYEGSTEESNRSNLEAAVAAAPDVIVMITFDFEDLAKEFAEANPDQQFLLVDSCPEGAPANLHCAVFREHEAAYLLGVEAGLRTQTNKVGSVGAVDIPFIHRYTDAFALGAQSVNTAVSDTQLFIGGSSPFADPAKGKEQALAMAATGADHVFAVASGSNGGVFEAAEERNFTGYGVDVNQCGLAPGYVGDGTIKDVEGLVVTEIGKILDGTAEAVSSYGLAEGGMTLVSLADGAADSGCTVMEHPEIVEQLAQTRQQIIDGDIVVPDAAS